jgi:thiamine transport system substrate-binding protein
VPLPEEWERAAPMPRESISLPGEQVQENRERWISEWRELLEG